MASWDSVSLWGPLLLKLSQSPQPDYSTPLLGACLWPAQVSQS